MRLGKVEENLSDFYSRLIYGDAKVAWSELETLQYLAILPLNIVSTALNGLFVLSLCFNNYNCFLILAYELTLFLSWFSGLLVVFFGTVYKNLTDDFEVIMSSCCFIVQFTLTLINLHLFKKRSLLKLEQKIQRQLTAASSSINI